MSLKLFYIYLLFHAFKLLKVSLDIAFVSGVLLASFDKNVIICITKLNLNYYYLGPDGFDLLLLILGHSVLFIGLFNKSNTFFYYLLLVFLLFILNYVVYQFFGYYEDSPGLPNLLFYFFDLFVFWILELGLLPIALTFVASKH